MESFTKKVSGKNRTIYKVKIKNKESSHSKIEDVNSCLKDQIQKYLDHKKSLQDTVVQLQTENVNLTDLLAAKTSESETFKFKISESEAFKFEITKLQSNVSLFQKNYQEIKNNVTTFKEDVKSPKTKETYDGELSQLMKSIEVIKSVNTSLKKQLEECHRKEETLKDSLKISEAEKQTVLQQLSNKQEVIKQLTIVLQKQKQIVSNLLKKFNRKGKGLSELKKGIQMLESQIVNFEQLLKGRVEEAATLKKSSETIKEENEDQLTGNEVKLLETKKDIDMPAKMVAMEKELRKSKAKKEALRESLKNVESEKQVLSDDLNEEKKKVACLNDQLKAQTENILALKKELFRKKVEVIKTSENMAIIQCEKVILENNLREKDNSAESLKNSILLLQADKQNLSDMLIAEKKKSESLQIEVAELKLQIGDRGQRDRIYESETLVGKTRRLLIIEDERKSN